MLFRFKMKPNYTGDVLGIYSGRAALERQPKLFEGF